MAYLIFENDVMKFFTQEDPSLESSIIKLKAESVVKEVADDFDIVNKIITLVDGNIDVQEDTGPTIADIDYLRHARNEKLKETDLWGLQDYPVTDEQRAYRQALRDITNTATSLDDVVWPTKPS
jgi:hypothetical protein